jgi:hypothetical protein
MIRMLDTSPAVPVHIPGVTDGDARLAIGRLGNHDRAGRDAYRLAYRLDVDGRLTHGLARLHYNAAWGVAPTSMGAGRSAEHESKRAHAQTEQYSSHDKLLLRDCTAHAEGTGRAASTAGRSGGLTFLTLLERLPAMDLRCDVAHMGTGSAARPDCSQAGTLRVWWAQNHHNWCSDVKQRVPHRRTIHPVQSNHSVHVNSIFC